MITHRIGDASVGTAVDLNVTLGQVSRNFRTKVCEQSPDTTSIYVEPIPYDDGSGVLKQYNLNGLDVLAGVMIDSEYYNFTLTGTDLLKLSSGAIVMRLKCPNARPATNRRKTTRYPYIAEATFDQGNGRLNCNLSDISLTGMALTIYGRMSLDKKALTTIRFHHKELDADFTLMAYPVRQTYLPESDITRLTFTFTDTATDATPIISYFERREERNRRKEAAKNRKGWG